jgi:hypothetical protein
MLYVHKKSPTPIDPWPVIRHGGPNNLGLPEITARYLLLWNVDIVHREGHWHYIFEFDARNSLETSALAQLVASKQSYPNDMDWKRWLSPGFTVISASVREEILNMPADEAHTDTVITNMRPVPATTANKHPEPKNWIPEDNPDEFLMMLG